jgi:hypothetical protein
MPRKRWFVTLVVLALCAGALWFGGGRLWQAFLALHGHHE